jgi:CDP-glycerol glycerophosphotransferase (TagB/SpsB family)
LSKADNLDIEVIIPALDDPEGTVLTLDSVGAQRLGGFALSITVVASDESLQTVREAVGGDERVRVIESTFGSHGASINQAVREGGSPMVAIVNPGEELSPGSLLKMAEALREDEGADIACIPSRPADKRLDPPYTPVQDAAWPGRTEPHDVREEWWMARPSFRGTLVRRSALSEVLESPDGGRGVECGTLLRMQRVNPRVVFVAGESVDFHYPDEFQARLFPGSAEPSWYRVPIEEWWPAWLEECDDGAVVAAFAQAMAMSAVAVRFGANADNLNKHLLSGDDLEHFFDACGALLSFVDDEMILAPDSRGKLGLDASLALTLYLLKRRGDETGPVFEETESASRGDWGLTVDGHLFERAEDEFVRLWLIDHDPATGDLIIDGKVQGLAWLAGGQYFARVSVVGSDGAGQKAIVIPLEHRSWYALAKHFGVATTKSYAFRVRIPIPAEFKSLGITFRAGSSANPMDVVFSGHHTKVSRHPRRSWWAFADNYLCYLHPRIVVRPRSLLGILRCEVSLLLSLMRGPVRRRAYNRGALLSRIAYWLTYPLYANKPRWFFIDKVYKAGDSAEYLYRYSLDQDDGIIKDYVLSDSSEDYARMVAEGLKPLKAGSLRHLLALLHADMVFASNSTVFSLNGLKTWRSFPFRGFIHSDTVCVQHGLSVQNIAVAQNRLVDNTRLYLLASHVEKENLSKPVYAYDDYPDALQITGIPRYDGLVPDDRKQILIHPTWRMQFAMPVITHEGEARPYNPRFKDSPYFHVYSSLISNEKLIACAKETGYSVKYVLHPVASSQVCDFPESDPVEIIGASGALNYEQVLSQSSLMVTDYSGVQFDFAYMRKPVVYYHPPALPPHYAASTFSYDTMAFGEICPDEQRLVDLLCEYMREGCRMKPEYSERVDSFFAFDDRRNCERAYRAALDYMRVRSERR